MMSSGGRVRPGFSLVELNVVLVLASLVGVAVAGLARQQERLARSQAQRVARSEGVRTAEMVLAAELRYLEPGEDVRAISDQAIALRVFRGTAIVCATEEDAVRVRFRGLRAPVPEKDSVLAVRADSAALALDLETSSPATGCVPGDGERVYRWSAGAPLATGTLLLLFESGSYHLHDAAFRYRRGAGGRQPLTGEVFGPDGSFQGRTADGAPTYGPDGLAAVIATLEAEGAPATRVRIGLAAPSEADSPAE